jgi:outer membrane lipoprotein-sorting protein
MKVKTNQHKFSCRFLIFLLCLSPLFSSERQKKETELDGILAQLEKNFNSAETVSVEFSQTKKITQLSGELSLSGQLTFKKPHFLKLEMRGDENLDLYTDGASIWLVDLDFDEVDVYEFGPEENRQRFSRLLPPVFLRSVEELKENYNISLDSGEGEKKILLISPRSGSESTFLAVTLEIDSLGRIDWMKVVYPQNEYIETRFRNWKKYPEISDHFFRYRGSKKKKEPGTHLVQP